jgi:hypothetical protein
MKYKTWPQYYLTSVALQLLSKKETLNENKNAPKPAVLSFSLFVIAKGKYSFPYNKYLFLIYNNDE